MLYPRSDDDYLQPAATENNDVAPAEFRVYWNVPTFQCHKYGYSFAEVAEWGIQQNAGDSFRGDKISLLYDPGLFPALMQSGGGSAGDSFRGGDYVVRNGGVPHEGNLTKHLDIFTRDLITKLVPEPSFSGKLIGYAEIEISGGKKKNNYLSKNREHAV